MGNQPKIVVVGSANTDLTLQLPRLPVIGESVIGGKFLRALGGKGANQAVAAARLGAEVTFVCRLGRDDFGQACYQTYQKEGLNVDFVSWDDQQPTGVAFIFVNEKGENMIGVVAGANMALTPADVDRAAGAIAGADLLMLQMEVPTATSLRAAEIARQHGLKVTFNPAPPAALPVELLERVDVLTPNETELEFIVNALAAQTGSPASALEWLSHKVPHLVITLGAQGCRVISGGQDVRYPAFPVQAVDSTAAGDAFNGGLAVALARGDSLPAAIRFASAVGALAVTRLGAMNSLPNAAEVEEFLRSR